MTMDLPIFEADLKLVSSGLFPGLNRLSAPLWESSENIDFGGFGAATSKGASAVDFDVFLFDTAAGNFDSASGLFDDLSGATALMPPTNKEVIGLCAVIRSDGTMWIFFGTRDKLYGYDGATLDTSATTYTGIKDSGGTLRATQWSMVTVGDWIIASNGVDATQIRKTTTWADLTGPSFTWAKIVRKYGPYVIAINTSNGGKLVEWCSDDNVENWTPAADNTAGNLLLRELTSDPIAAEMLGSFLAIYTESQLLRFVYRPNAFVFGVDGVISGCGAVSKSSIIPAAGVHYGLQKQGIFKTDGFSISWVDYPAFGEWLKNNVNWEQHAKISGYHDPWRKQLRWSVPLTGSLDNNFEIVYNYVTGAISSGSAVFYSALEKDVFEFPLIGSNNGGVLFAQYGEDYRGNAVTRSVQTKPLDCGARTEWKYVDYVETELKVNSGSGPTISIGWQETADGPITWTTPETVNLTVNQNFIRVSGVFLTLRWESSSDDDDWSISGFKIFGTRDGGTI